MDVVLRALIHFLMVLLCMDLGWLCDYAWGC